MELANVQLLGEQLRILGSVRTKLAKCAVLEERNATISDPNVDSVRRLERTVLGPLRIYHRRFIL
tara:strand:+ start:320 stop:514 length:195 start_codon:yes stop_codon:yes gene_type:complete